MAPLPPLPARFLDGTTRGTFAGSGALGPIDLPGRPWLALREKRWLWVGIAVPATKDTPERFVACTIVHVGYAASAFAFVADPRRGPPIVDRSFLGAPGLNVQVARAPDAGARAHFQSGKNRATLERPGGDASEWRIDIALGDLEVSARFPAAPPPPPLVVVGHAAPGRPVFTQKSCPLPVEGTLTVRGEQIDLGRAGALAGLDFTCGYMPRRTAWRWGFALGRSDGKPTAFNLALGNNIGGENENALWHDGRLVPLPPVTFDVPVTLSDPWRIQGSDGSGAVDLTFRGEGMHREDKNLVLVRSHFAQIAGTWTGTIRDGARAIAIDLPGVAEDQDTVW